MQVDSANIPIDTLVVNSGFYYKVSGNPGTVYKYTIISTSPGIQITCPANGIILDTVSAIVNAYVTKDFGFECSAAAAFDLAESVTVRTGRHHASATILVTNNYCNSQNGVLTLHFSPKYDYQSAVPAPTTVNGNTLTWNLSNPIIISTREYPCRF